MRTRALPTTPEAREPLGIVISDGGQGDAAPRFAAFVWGPVPEEPDAHVQDKELVASVG